MANKNPKQNIPTRFENLPPEKLHEITSKGGKAAQKVLHERKTMRQTLEMLLELPVKEREKIKKLSDLGIPETEMNQQMLAMVAVMKRAQTGDFYSNSFMRDTIGQKEPEKLDLIKPVEINITDDYGDKK